MEYRQLGNSGLRVSVIGLGTNRFGGDNVPQEAVSRMVDAAAEKGVNLIDTADVYTGGRSEETLGVALKGRWHQFVLASKFFNDTGGGPNDWGGSRYHMIQAVEASLRRLQSDHIDLYYLHRWDASTPIEETLRGLDDLVRAGKVRYIGASQFAAWQLADANMLAYFNHQTPFVALQAHYHLLERGAEREQLPYCKKHGTGFIPFFPLAGGFLTGKYKRGEPAPAGSRGETNTYVQQYMTERNYTRVERLAKWAQARGHAMNELAHAWLLAQPQVCSIISGATRLAQFESNVEAAAWTLTPAEVAEVNAILDEA